MADFVLQERSSNNLQDQVGIVGLQLRDYSVRFANQRDGFVCKDKVWLMEPLFVPRVAAKPISKSDNRQLPIVVYRVAKGKYHGRYSTASHRHR